MPNNTSKRVLGRKRRKKSIRKRITGSSERPRLSIFRSARHIYAQVIDDRTGATLAAESTLSKDVKPGVAGKNKIDQARAVGEAIGKACLAKNITQVSFDRNGYIYHGRVAAVADGAREAGLEF